MLILTEGNKGAAAHSGTAVEQWFGGGEAARMTAHKKIDLLNYF